MKRAFLFGLESFFIIAAIASLVAVLIRTAGLAGVIVALICMSLGVVVIRKARPLALWLETHPLPADSGKMHIAALIANHSDLGPSRPANEVQMMKPSRLRKTPFLNDSFRQLETNRSQVHRSHVPWKTPKNRHCRLRCGTHNGQALHHVYFENGPGAIGGQAAAKDEVRLANVAKLLDYMLSA